MSKLCPYCKSKKVGSFNDEVMCCMACHRLFGKSQLVDSTIFDCITASPEVLAKSSVYCLSSDLCRSDEGKFIVKSNWKSPFIDRCYDTEAKAIAATLVRLKEVEK